MRRALEVVLKFLPLWLSHLMRTSSVGRTAVRRGVVAGKEQWLADLVNTLALLGPMGIKWGQWASTRYDLFEDDVCEALAELTNQAPMHSFEVTKEVVERSFGGQPLEELFSSFETEPVASGSIAQVHIATLVVSPEQRQEAAAAGLVAEASAALRRLLDLVAGALGVEAMLSTGNNNGGAFLAASPAAAGGGGGTGDVCTQQKVAVKVQHPNLSQGLETDMALLKWVGSWAGSRVAQTVDQFASNFECQLDFNDEADNLIKFSKHFNGPFWGSMVSFPQPIPGMVTAEVLVETFEPGESVAKFLSRSTPTQPVSLETATTPSTPSAPVAVSTAESWDLSLKTNIGVTGMQAFLKMLIWDNFIHADLHPGNVLVRMVDIGPLARLQRWVVLGDSSPQAPHIVLLDAGLAASFDPKIYSHVSEFFSAIVDNDGVFMARSILNLDPQGQPFVKDREAFVVECADVFERHHRQFEDLSEGRAGDNIKEFMALIRKHDVIIDPAVMVALMSMMVLEGWQFRLSPEVGVLDNIRDAMGGGSAFGMVNRLSSQVQETLKEVRSLLP